MDFYRFWGILEGALPYELVSKDRSHVSWDFSTPDGAVFGVTAASMPLEGGGEIARVDFDERLSGDDAGPAGVSKGRSVYETVSGIIRDLESRARPAGFWFQNWGGRRASIVSRLVDRDFPGWGKWRGGDLVAVYNPGHRHARAARDFIEREGPGVGHMRWEPRHLERVGSGWERDPLGAAGRIPGRVA